MPIRTTAAARAATRAVAWVERADIDVSSAQGGDHVHHFDRTTRRDPSGLRVGCHEAQQVAMNRASTVAPKRNDDTGTRSSMPWNIGAKSRSAGSFSGAKP